MLDVETEALELTEDQMLMLQPPDARINQIKYPDAVKKRGHLARLELRKSQKRKSKWGSKFKQVFTGKVARAWRQKVAQHGQASLEDELAPRAKTRAEPKAKAKAKAKANAEAKAKAKADSTAEIAKAKAKSDMFDDKHERQKHLRKELKAREEQLGHDMLKTNVRVVAECREEGRNGQVSAVYKNFETKEEPE